MKAARERVGRAIRAVGASARRRLVILAALLVLAGAPAAGLALVSDHRPTARAPAPSAIPVPPRAMGPEPEDRATFAAFGRRTEEDSAAKRPHRSAAGHDRGRRAARRTGAVRRRARVRRHVRALEAAQPSVERLLPINPRLGDVRGTGALVWPVRGRVSSRFGQRWGRLHAGIDIAAPAGTPIRAADAGRVVVLATVAGYGRYLCVQHTPSVATCYAHLSRYATARGASVRQGQVVGYVGCTGHCYGDHLHFETRVNRTPVDPMRYLRGGRTPAPPRRSPAPDKPASGDPDKPASGDTEEPAGGDTEELEAPPRRGSSPAGAATGLSPPPPSRRTEDGP